MVPSYLVCCSACCHAIIYGLECYISGTAWDQLKAWAVLLVTMPITSSYRSCYYYIRILVPWGPYWAKWALILFLSMIRRTALSFQRILQMLLLFMIKPVLDNFGILMSLFVILLIGFTKKYKQFVYRLVVYLMMGNILLALCQMLELIPIRNIYPSEMVLAGQKCVLFLATWMS